MIKNITVFIFFLLVGQLGAIFGENRPRVVATTSIVGDWVSQVAGDLVEVEVLVERGMDVHSFEPSPRDVIGIKKADLVFEIGNGLEYWLEGLGGDRVVLGGVVEPIYFQGCCHHHHHDHVHEEVDPHVWLDAGAAVLCVEEIERRLIEAYPKYEAVFKRNGARYIGELKELDAWIRGEVGKIDKGKRMLFTNHNSFGYFARAYGFRVIGDVLGSLSTEHGDPSARRFRSLVEDLRGSGVKAIFAEWGQSRRLIDELAREAGLPYPTVLYSGALSEGGEGDTYIKMMRENVKRLVEGLR